MKEDDDQLAYIAPQCAHADVVVRFEAQPGYFLPGTTGDHDDAHLNVRIDLHERLPRLDLDDILANGSSRVAPAIRFHRGGRAPDVRRRFMTLEIDGTVAPNEARELDARIWAHMDTHHELRPEDIGAFQDGTATSRHSDPLALAQLVVAYQVVRASTERGRAAAAPAPRPGLVPAVVSGA